MARRQVLEIVCDRCKKTETQDVPEGEEDKVDIEVEITFHGETVKYGDLCKNCRKAVANLFKKIAKQAEEPKGDNVTPIEPKKAPEKRRFLGGK